MEKMKYQLIVLLAWLCTSGLWAQNVDNLWITGSAVPGGIQQLERFPNHQFKFAGTLLPGEVKVMTTAGHDSQTQYLVPRYYQSYVVNNGLAYKLSDNADEPGWIVTFEENRYRFTVDTSARKLKGELFQPWDELFIVGGCVECGWESYVMLPFKRQKDQLCTWTWTGELREHPENVEPRRFKIMGQNAWDPKQLHPFTQDESPLQTTQLSTGGDDNKWQIPSDGYYRLTVDVFRETLRAEFLGTSADTETDIQHLQPPTSTPTPPVCRLYTAQGTLVEETKSSQPPTSNLQPGIYLLNIGGKTTKIVVK